MCVCVCVCVSVSVVHWALDSMNYMEGGSPLPYVKFSTLIPFFLFFFCLLGFGMPDVDFLCYWKRLYV